MLRRFCMLSSRTASAVRVLTQLVACALGLVSGLALQPSSKPRIQYARHTEGTYPEDGCGPVWDDDWTLSDGSRSKCSAKVISLPSHSVEHTYSGTKMIVTDARLFYGMIVDVR